MDDDTFDTLLDDATHAVNNLIPDAVISSLSAAEHSNLLYRINDALTPILRDVIAQEA